MARTVIVTGKMGPAFDGANITIQGIGGARNIWATSFTFLSGILKRHKAFPLYADYDEAMHRLDIARNREA